MIEYAKYRWALNKLLRERQRVNAKLTPPALHEEYFPLQEEHDELEIIEHKIYRLTSDYYWEKAFRLGVPFPSGEEFWEDSKAYPGTAHLNRKGLSALKAAFHESRKHTLEVAAVWFAGLTGLVGAVTGLVAIARGG